MSKEKINNALQRYYKAFDYDAGTLAYKRGGRMGFSRKYEGGGDFNGGTITPATVTPESSNDFRNWLRRVGSKITNSEGKSFNDDVYGTGDETWQKISGNNPYVAFTSMALGAVGDAIGSMRTDAEKEKEALRGIETYGDGMFGNISDNDALMIASQNIAPISGLTEKQVGLKSKAEELFSPFATAINTGLTTGNAYIGAAAGLFDFGKNLIKRNKAEKLMETTRKAAIKKNQDLYKQLYLASGRVDDINDEARMKTFINDAFEYAYGGEMHSHGATFDNGLTFINEGGTHEQNPLEGVPSGVDENGVPNLVEEGEVIWNNEYVFSNRIKIPKRLAEKYKLDEGLTFADAIKAATKESLTRPNDPISNDTNRDIVNEFMDEQEAIRGAEQQKAAQQVQQAIDEDFASQLEALGSTGQTPMAPVNLQMEQPQESMPVMGAYGDRKFEKGGDKWREYYTVETDENGNKYYLAPDGVAQYTEAGAKKHYELNGSTWAPPSRVYGDVSRNYPNGGAGYQGGGVGGGSRSGKVGGLSNSTKGYMAQTFADLNTVLEGPVRFTSGQGDKRQEEGLPEGLQVVYNQGASRRGPIHSYVTSDGRRFFGKDMEEAKSRAVAAQNEINNPKSYSVTPGTQAYMSQIFDELNGYGSLNGTPSVTQRPSAPVQQNAITNAIDNLVTKNPEVADSLKSMVEQTAEKPASTKPSTPQSKTGGSSSSLKKDTRGRDAEANPLYKTLVETLDKASDEDKKRFVEEINKSLPEGKKVKDYAAWRKGATDGAWGSIHEATVKFVNDRANESVQRKATAVDPNSTISFPNRLPTIKGGLAGGLSYRPKGGTSTQPAGKSTPAGRLDGYNLARMAPIYGAGAMALNDILTGPQYDNADAIIEAARLVGTPVNIPVQTIGDYMSYKPFDERYLVNLANQNRAAGVRTLTNTSGGNRAMDMLGAMTLAHGNQYDLGEIARQAYLANQQQRVAVKEFNRGTNIQNMSAINQRNLSQAQLNSQRQQAMLNGLAHGYGLRQNIWQDWRNDRDTNLETLFDNLGLWGREGITDNQALSFAKEMGYNWTYNPKTGEITFVNPSAKGGKKNKKRRF